MGASKSAFDPEAVRRQLGQILASGDFDASERNRRFLSYAVEETLEGRAHRIKAYAVATSVFGRGKDFDPQVDAIVRIEAGRLRRSLEHYYLKAGRDDAIRISLPRGSYAAAFDRPRGDGPPSGHSPALETASPPLEAMGPAILVTPFEEDGFHSEFSNFTRGLTRHVVVALTRCAELRVFGPQTSFRHGSLEVNSEPAIRRNIDFLLAGGTSLSTDHFSVEALLVDARDGRNLWARAYERDLRASEIAAVGAELASSVVRALSVQTSWPARPLRASSSA